TGTVQQLTDEEWQRTFAVNTTGVFNMCRAVAKRMVPRRRGAIVTVSSNAAGVPRHGMSAYAASKAAATSFTKCLGLELAEYGIRCNVVAPGSTDTEMQRGMWTEENGPEQIIKGSLETYRAGIPLGKLATPDDIADAVVFLVSDQACHSTMHDRYADGGATLRAKSAALPGRLEWAQSTAILKTSTSFLMTRRCGCWRTTKQAPPSTSPRHEVPCWRGG